MDDTAIDDLAADAEAVVADFIGKHRAGAIPALLGACVMWSVEHGGYDVISRSLRRVSAMADDMQAEFLKVRQ